MKFKLNKVLAGCAIFSALAFVGQAQAAGTVAGTSISNTANLTFSVGAVAQNPVASNTVSFVVDNKVLITVVNDNAGAASIVTPGGTGFVHKFKVTNGGNSPQDVLLALTSTGFAGQSLFGGTDNFDVTGCSVFAESTAAGTTYESATDTATFIDELAPDAAKEVYAVCGVPATRVNNDVSIVSLKATAAVGGGAGAQGAALVQTTGANTAGIDIVFADAAGSDDAVRDGSHSARGSYLVQAATLSVTKTAAPICDPSNFITNPKNIPGSFVRYSITIANAAGAGASATLGSMTDAIDAANLTFDPNLIAPTGSSCDTASPAESAAGRAFKLSCVGGSRACVATPAYKTGASDADGFDYTAGTVTANFATGLAAEGTYGAGELKAGESVRLDFNVQVK